jgi:D-arabinose 1-dehydrogenase-like Zn-dependent alcohol dehydrogenase
MFSRLGSLFKEGQMIPTKAYAAQNATTDPTPWSFEYREPGPHEILIDITFSNP